MAKSRYKGHTGWDEIRAAICGLFRELNSGDDDRAEARIAGVDVRVRHVRVNGRLRFVVERKSHWQERGQYRECPIETLADDLWAGKYA